MRKLLCYTVNRKLTYERLREMTVMEILGLKVRHEKLGVGMITHRAGNLFIVTFPARHGPKLREYIYPDAFAGTLEAVNIAVQEAILKMIEEKQKQKQQEQRQEKQKQKQQ